MTASQSNGNNVQPQWIQSRPGERCLIHVDAAATKGVYSFVEILSDPGDGTPLHLHKNEDEYIMVVEGVGRFALGDRIFDVEAGTMVTLERNIPHAWGNRSNAPLRLAAMVYPGGCEEGLRAAAKAMQSGNLADLRAIGERLGVDVIGPTPF